jgi:hypothetical protein
VKDGIMDAYDINRYSYRGETALYNLMQADGYAPGAASNMLLTNIFGSALIGSLAQEGLNSPSEFAPTIVAIAGLPPGTPLVDLTGVPIDGNDYVGAWTPGPLSLSYSLTPTAPLVITQCLEGSNQALVQIPWAGAPNGTYSTLIPWTPNVPGNGFAVGQYGNSTLDYFVQSASLDFTGTTTTALVDYAAPPGPGGTTEPDGTPSGTACTFPNATMLQLEAAESSDFLGDVFLCFEPAASPPLLAVRMYTPTQAVIDWLNSVPSSYSDCGMIVRWSPYENYVDMIESTYNGVRLDVTQGGGLGRVVGAEIYVPNPANYQE